ncbi:hypothetical protein AB0I23_29560 [Streptomyces atratus]
MTTSDRCRPNEATQSTFDEVVVAGGGDLRGASRAGRGQPQQPALVVGEREEEQAVGLMRTG